MITGLDLGATKALPLGYEEYLAQDREGRLWYFKLRLYGEYQIILASDRLNPNPGGVVYRNISFRVVQQIPLDEYEKQIHEELLRLRGLVRGPQAMEESDIIFDLLLHIFAWDGELTVKFVIDTAELLFDVFTGESGGLEGAVTDKFLTDLYWMLGCNGIVNVKKDWMIDLSAYGTGKVTNLLTSKSGKTSDPRERILHLILAFKYKVDQAKFREQYKEALQKMEEKKYK